MSIEAPSSRRIPSAALDSPGTQWFQGWSISQTRLKELSADEAGGAYVVVF
jgi:hypothetical protein